MGRGKGGRWRAAEPCRRSFSALNAPTEFCTSRHAIRLAPTFPKHLCSSQTDEKQGSYGRNCAALWVEGREGEGAQLSRAGALSAPSTPPLSSARHTMRSASLPRFQNIFVRPKRTRNREVTAETVARTMGSYVRCTTVETRERSRCSAVQCALAEPEGAMESSRSHARSHANGKAQQAVQGGGLGAGKLPATRRGRARHERKEREKHARLGARKKLIPWGKGARWQRLPVDLSSPRQRPNLRPNKQPRHKTRVRHRAAQRAANQKRAHQPPPTPFPRSGSPSERSDNCATRTNEARHASGAGPEATQGEGGSAGQPTHARGEQLLWTISACETRARAASIHLNRVSLSHSHGTVLLILYYGIARTVVLTNTE